MVTRFTIGFDERPGQSGPARYVGSIVRGMDSEEFEPIFVTGCSENVIGYDTRVSSQTVASRGRRSVTRLVPVPIRNWIGFAKDSLSQANNLKQHLCDVFHTQRAGCEESPVAARWAGVPQVLGTFHVDSTYDLRRERTNATYRALEWISNRCLHKAIAVSEATKRDWMRRTGISEHRVVTIHNGIDPEHFRRRQSRAKARAALGLPENALILGGVGRLDPAKGFANLIEALALLSPEFPQAMVAIAGNGLLRNDLEASANALGVADRVVFLGFQSDVNPVFDACDVFVMPSLCETLGYALLEAMAHELPAVGSDVGGIPEVILPEETGFLAGARNATALANALRPLLKSPELRQRFGKAGRERVVRHFHERDTVAKTIGVYREMLRSQPHNGASNLDAVTLAAAKS